MRKLKITELKRLSPEDFKQTEKMPVIVVLDNVRSLHNVGSVFRTSDAFLIEAIYLCGITATPPHAEIHKTALGAENTVEWQYFEHTLDAIRLLKQKDYHILAVEQAEDSIPLDKFRPENLRYAVVLGNEVKGIDQTVMDYCDACIEIPQFGTKHSLNVSVAAGIVLWEIFKVHPFQLTQQYVPQLHLFRSDPKLI
ncbi:MAG: RNA methyltransferase [Candidatus Azobacteroides sp.]|nr:RNA methyltransferase [Candidatus Azobacteroides sp.]